MKITVVKTFLLDLGDVCTTPDGERHSGPAAIYDACRHMIAQGTDPKVLVKFYRGEKEVMRGRMGDIAMRTWSGNDRDPKDRKWRPHPEATLAPLLEQWWQKVSG